ncbi:FG-GAP-like repeat-containing protein [Flavivirga rizhaonensis]|uniref:T9SS type A sorting domain-containing protein n=1 Tax=Flavivirga rizhaonensis TaxID=2559571 RepID=A0A4V3P4K7_9FLAO|nr:FG-GAP-like repeat-containing protein [Flavivirga rizhaonensis]TGV01854.1 T9SS type A sorting domain-containing protein [Flavivirga rizhaonensis]
MKKKYVIVYVVFYVAFGTSFVNAQEFKEISEAAGISTFCYDNRLMSGGVAFIDYNNDNYQDIFVIGGEFSNALYKNNWDGTFTDVSSEAGLIMSGVVSMGVTAGDIDNDGDDDIFITTNEDSPNLLFENNGNGTFSNISKLAGITHTAWSSSATLGDFNLDGLLDIYVVNYVDFVNPPFDLNISGGQSNFLYQNLGNNLFKEVATEMGVADIGCGLATAFTDCDADGDLDIVVANDFGYKFQPNELYINQYPQQGFRKLGEEAQVDAQINAMGVAIGDYDKDLDLDYYITNMGANPFYENIDSMIYQDVSKDKDLVVLDGTSWGTVFFDYDNDTNLDLFVANGEIFKLTTQNQKNKLFRGMGNGLFEDISEETKVDNPENCRGLSCADIDNDGDLDILLGVVSNDTGSGANTLLYENVLQDQKHHLKVKLQGVSSNHNGYGSRITMITNGEQLIREVDGGSSYLSSHANSVHFGLGQNTIVDKLIVDWVGGEQDVYTNIPADISIKIIQGKSNWIELRNEIITIKEGENINLGGKVYSNEGIYKHIVLDEQGRDSLQVVTRLLIDKEANVDTDPNNQKALLYPNPISKKSLLKYHVNAEESQVDITASDLVGRTTLLYSGMKQRGDHILNLNNLTNFIWSSGVYFFIVKIGDKQYNIKGLVP